MAVIGRPRTFDLTLSDVERKQLQEWAASRSLPHALVQRAQSILLSADGLANTEVADQVGLSHPMVGHWRRRFQQDRLAGLYDAPRSGRPRTHDDDEVARLLRTVLNAKPENATHWSVRSVATKTGISKSTVQRYFALFGVQPHRTKSFVLSTDPFFVEKVRDVVGLYLNPPDKALVLSVDEKSQIQALERTQRNLPLGLGYVEGITHGYTRHGTTTLFAALDVESGDVIAQCKRRHRHQEFLAFLRHLDANVPAHLDVHPSSTIMRRTSTRRSEPGSPVARATMCTSRRPTRRGSTRWSVGLGSSLSRQFAATRSAASASSSTASRRS